MGYPAEGLLNRVIKTVPQWKRIRTLYVRIGITLVVSVATVAAFPLPALAVNCTECNQEMDANQLCHNPSCSGSTVHCIRPATDTPAHLVPAATALQSNTINLDLSNSEVTGSEPDAVSQDDNQAPRWLLNISHEIARNEDNHPNIGALISRDHLISAQLSFSSIDEATDTLQNLLSTRHQHFVISYYFWIGEEEFAFHMAIAVDQGRRIFVLSNMNPEGPSVQPAENIPPLDWRYATQATSNDIISALGLNNGSFLPSEEIMIVNYLTTVPRSMVQQPREKLDTIIEESRSK
ncbi:hypothetical protein NX722_16540 [Endozoicomonas gorgoniicola]|uniref:TPM domain-containing protein n=1 Tax=Endozoicomonas gorgoniicola TaxID=1234144 RepID=A0ABT3MXS6_9GAMM|nr:hypothetical protein [Endozoicomonas gorgoniicola]MCW7554198.1 hypothetical protein [Endozoicomonas gorgoniicola]